MSFGAKGVHHPICDQPIRALVDPRKSPDDTGAACMPWLLFLGGLNE